MCESEAFREVTTGPGLTPGRRLGGVFVDALRVGHCGSALTDSVRGGLRREIYTSTHTNILAPLVVEFPTSATKDVEHLVVHRNVLSD